MSELTEKCIRYFAAPKHYFWQWAENGAVIEFANGRTICYREDLTFLIASAQLRQAPSVGAVLLLLCACKDNYDEFFGLESHLYKLGYDKDYNEGQPIAAKELIGAATSFLKLVNDLPLQDRSGMKRLNLLQAVFNDTAANSAGNNEITRLVNSFNTGQQDEAIFGPQAPYGFQNLESDLAPLAAAYHRYGDAGALLTWLKTGLLSPPTAAEIELPNTDTSSLLAQLLADTKTEGLVRVARQVMAALNIPMHFNGRGDNQFGGVAAITNRGDYDKLLLSELAQDDVLLMARLANNEALFLQRERLPAHTPTQWHVLMDTTLKSWGTPRVFALSAALAFSEGKKDESLQGWALGKTEPEEIDLHSKNGIVAALEKIDAGLHCGAALQKIITQQKDPASRFVLIRFADEQPDISFLMSLDSVRGRLDYQIEVNRNGRIEMYDTRGKRHRLLAKALIDLDELHYKTAAPSRREVIGDAGLPAFMRSRRRPLYFPASKIKIKHPKVYKPGNGGAAVITLDNRLLFWQDRHHGALELIDKLESADNYHWGEGTGAFDNFIFLLIQNAGKSIWLYAADISNCSYQVHQLDQPVVQMVGFNENKFYCRSASGVIEIDQHTGEHTPFDAARVKPAVIQHYNISQQIKQMINVGYSVINSGREIAVCEGNLLLIDQYGLCLNEREGNKLYWTLGNNRAQVLYTVKAAGLIVEHLRNLKFAKYKWPGGSEIVLDSRGMLHLKSADKSIPEITMIAVVSQPIACWSADGACCGSSYFISDTTAKLLTDQDFYQRYILKFIQALR